MERQGWAALLRAARAAKREEQGILRGSTQLKRAAQQNDLPRVLQLVQLGAPLELVDENKRSALLWLAVSATSILRRRCSTASMRAAARQTAPASLRSWAPRRASSPRLRCGTATAALRLRLPSTTALPPARPRCARARRNLVTLPRCGGAANEHLREICCNPCARQSTSCLRGMRARAELSRGTASSHNFGSRASATVFMSVYVNLPPSIVSIEESKVKTEPSSLAAAKRAMAVAERGLVKLIHVPAGV
jgi:hypothetical protein